MITQERLQEIKKKYKNGVPEMEIENWISKVPIHNVPAEENPNNSDLNYEEEFEWKGRLYTVQELAEIAGINAKTMSCRLDRYKTMAEVMAVEPAGKKAASGTQEPKKQSLTKKRGKIKLYFYHGEYYNASELSRLVGMPRNTLHQRLKIFGNAEDAINKPYNTKARNNISLMLKAGGISKETFYKACKKGVTLSEFFGVKV